MNFSNLTKEKIEEVAAAADLTTDELLHGIYIQAAIGATKMMHTRSKVNTKNMAHLADMVVMHFGLLSVLKPETKDPIILRSLMNRFEEAFPNPATLKQKLHAYKEVSSLSVAEVLQVIKTKEGVDELREHLEKAEEYDGEAFVFKGMELPVSVARALLAINALKELLPDEHSKGKKSVRPEKSGDAA